MRLKLKWWRENNAKRSGYVSSSFRWDFLIYRANELSLVSAFLNTVCNTHPRVLFRMNICINSEWRVQIFPYTATYHKNLSNKLQANYYSFTLPKTYIQMKKNEKLVQEETEILNREAEPLRIYLRKHVMPVLANGLMECVRRRPDDPIDFLVSACSCPFKCPPFIYRKRHLNHSRSVFPSNILPSTHRRTNAGCEKNWKMISQNNYTEKLKCKNTSNCRFKLYCLRFRAMSLATRKGWSPLRKPAVLIPII